MDAKTFLSRIQKYYGLEYPEGQKLDVALFIQQQSDVYLDALYEQVLRFHSSKWKSLPDIGVFCDPEVSGPVGYKVQRALTDQSRAAIASERLRIGEDDLIDPEIARRALAEFQQRLREKSGGGSRPKTAEEREEYAAEQRRIARKVEEEAAC
jgi:hypothetical protein